MVFKALVSGIWIVKIWQSLGSQSIQKIPPDPFHLRLKFVHRCLVHFLQHCKLRIYCWWHNKLVIKDEITNFEVPGSHDSSALLSHLLDHDGEAGPLVSGPVRLLALPPAVGDRVTLGALLDGVSVLVTPDTAEEVPVNLWHPDNQEEGCTFFWSKERINNDIPKSRKHCIC